VTVVTVGKLRAVSTSQTALARSYAVEHIVSEIEDGRPKHIMAGGFGYRPSTTGYYAFTACGKQIMATHEPTYVTRGGSRTKLQTRQTRYPCKICSVSRSGGYMCIWIEPATRDQIF
jgi:hypothetical protein